MGDKRITMISNEEAKEPKPMEEIEEVEASKEMPDWLPDGWIMEVYRTEDGTINRYYTSPISNYTFTSKSEVLEYLFSGADERMLESKECSAENILQRQHEWLPKGWVMEVRASGENTNKMYKFYVHSITGVRLLSKQDVLLYINEAKVSGCDINEQCDSSSENNILAQMDFWPSGLPEGWIKELVYRKTKKGFIRKYPYYTDPASSYTFRTLKSALSFLETGVPKRAFIQRTSLHDVYSFEISTEMHESLRKRLTEKPKKSAQSRRAAKIEQDQNIDHLKDGDTSGCSDSPNESEEEETISNKMKAIGIKSN